MGDACFAVASAVSAEHGDLFASKWRTLQPAPVAIDDPVTIHGAR